MCNRAVTCGFSPSQKTVSQKVRKTINFSPTFTLKTLSPVSKTKNREKKKERLIISVDRQLTLKALQQRFTTPISYLLVFFFFFLTCCVTTTTGPFRTEKFMTFPKSKPQLPRHSQKRFFFFFYV